jgi:acetylornithine deacetylase/succinyl-diaminopimelate desuccinylase-like protein
LAEGELPDVVSFPDGWAGIDGELLLDLNSYALPPFVNPFTRLFSADSRAAPWMAGGQLVLTNNEVGRAVGVEPQTVPVRGGTDGCRLSFMGLPCPNVATGGMNAHGRMECIAVEDMDKMVEMLVALVRAR